MIKIATAALAAALALGVGSQVVNLPDAQTEAGRTDVHSDGRAGGKALPRKGNGTTKPSFGRHGIRKVTFEVGSHTEGVQLAAYRKPIQKSKHHTGARPGGPPSRPKPKR